MLLRNNSIKTIAVFQVLGGLHGLLSLTGWMSPAPQQDSPIITYALFPLLLIASIVAGVLLFQEKRRGYKLSIFLQLIQILRFTFGPINFGFNLLCSFGLDINISKQQLWFSFNIEILKTYLWFFVEFVYKFNLYLPFKMTLNLSAILCFIYLFYIFDQRFPMPSSPPVPETTSHN